MSQNRSIWVPDWQTCGTAERLSSEFNFKFLGPGWYNFHDCTVLIEVASAQAGDTGCWQNQWTADTVFIYSSFPTDPRIVFAEMSSAPIRTST